MNLYENQRSRPFTDLGRRSFRLKHFQTSFPLGWLKPNFMWSLHEMEEWKWIQMVYVTLPRWPPCSYIVKAFKNLILWNQKADGLEIWYAALVPRVLPSIFKWWPWVDLYLHVFYIKIKIGPFCFCMEKCLCCRFPRNCWSLWGESWYI